MARKSWEDSPIAAAARRAVELAPLDDLRARCIATTALGAVLAEREVPLPW